MHGTNTVSHNYSFHFHKARKLTANILLKRLKTLVEMAPIDKKARIHMLGEFIQGREKIIEDPYYVSIFSSEIPHILCFRLSSKQ